MALAQRHAHTDRGRWLLALVGIAGAALFFGDGIITPAISVLSAVEGLQVVDPRLHRFVTPIALVVILCLFLVQWYGTGVIGRLFGPVTLVWFLVLGVLGIAEIAANPAVLLAISPTYALHTVLHHQWVSVVALGAVVLAVLATGLWRQAHHALERRTLGRAALDVGSTFTYLLALFHMPLALAVAIGQTAPLMILVLSVAFLRERVAWQRWAAVVVGFAAVLLIARPGTDGFSWWAALSLLATLFSATRDIYTRVVPQRVPSLIITLATACAVTLTGVVLTAIAGWVPMTWEAWALLFGASVFLAGAYHLMIVAMRLGEVSFVGGFRYASLPLAAIVGWAVWGHLPDGVALAGMAVLVAAGLYLFRSGRATPPPPAAAPAGPPPARSPKSRA
jgi:drug/metabolite transporter (DMT)-like permease